MPNIYPSSPILASADPATGNELTRKSYVDALTTSKFNKAGGEFTGAINVLPSVLIIVGTGPGLVSLNGSVSNIFNLTLTTNSQLENPTSVVAGAEYYIFVKNTGAFSLSYAANYAFPGGVAPVITPTTGKTDIIRCFCSPFDGVVMFSSVVAQNM